MTKRYDNKIGEKPNNSVVNNRKIINKITGWGSAFPSHSTVRRKRLPPCFFVCMIYPFYKKTENAQYTTKFVFTIRKYLSYK